MKAIVYQRYGPPDVLAYQDVPTPTPRPDEVLVKVFAVSLNASDWEFLTGTPLYARIAGLRKPRNPILGSDIAGRVEAVGANVTKFAPGDHVFGDALEQRGGFAEYACIHEKFLTHKPESLSFVEAAALPQGGCIALQGIYKQNIQPGQRVLINGAGGSGGSFAIQMACHLGAHVTGVDHTKKINFMRQLGAHHVVDYTTQPVTQREGRYDLILDLVGHHSIFAFRRILNPHGTYLLVGGPMKYIFQTLLLGSLSSLLTTRTMKVLSVPPNAGMADLLALVEAGHVKPHIERTFPLQETPEALRLLGAGHAKGKLVIHIDPRT